MSELSSRLREIREDMGLSQTAFGKLGGVSKGSQIAYEQGKAQPAATYLQGLAEAGVNVLYLLTGRELVVLEPKGHLHDLLSVYPRLDETDQMDILIRAQAIYGRYVLDEEDNQVELRRIDEMMHALREGKTPGAEASSSPKSGRKRRKR